MGELAGAKGSQLCWQLVLLMRFEIDPLVSYVWPQLGSEWVCLLCLSVYVCVIHMCVCICVCVSVCVPVMPALPSVRICDEPLDLPEFNLSPLFLD